MSDTATSGSGLEQTRRLGVETTGIEIIEESERTARPRDLFWPWFAANVSVFGISYGSFVLGFGISFVQALVVTVVGVVVSFALCGIIAIAGKRGSAPTMILSRAAFGVQGQKLPGVISWLVSIGWETFLAILAVLATATIFDQLGWASGTSTQVVATVVVAALIVSASVAGYHVIMRMQSVLTWVTGVATVAYVALTVDEIDWSAVRDVPSGSAQQMVGALVMVMTGFGLGWINIAADWSRYQHRDAKGSSIVAWNTFGGAVAPVLLVTFGLLLAGSSEDLSAGIVADPIGTLGVLLPTWFLVPFLLAAILALVSGAVLGIYSSGLTLLSLGVRIPRPAAAFADGLVLTLGTVWVVFFAEDFLGPFQSFLITLGVPLAAWAGIMIADIALRRRDYDDEALFDSSGRYGAVDWTSVATMVGASVLGWGLVVNNFAADAAWNNWQGFLIGPLGLGTYVDDPAGPYWEGSWPYANLGVLLALVLGFAVTYVARRGTVRRQESGMESGTEVGNTLTRS
ncbi:allantoin permease [Nocardioides flavus (ex Wang et al. 2016)]|uniref:Allantoin permease n=1 Tax=Nocardioides flavus (ex Wang et al. 2016) TaxID=2058780 RepID=A0ABQ3HNY4_9ACTN|nr:cytosine permease [Nocardioides flavus (ex Wang et al. 2016)]GHE19393.1 allantoin permease [Nocardioides flavus (ex Wang et al. 2016)]